MRSLSFLARRSFARGALRGPSHRRHRRFEGQFFLKNGAPHWTSVNEKKNRMCRPTIFRGYCRYYGHYYYRMTTVVMPVATRRGITTSLYHVGQLPSLLQSSCDSSNDISYGKSTVAMKNRMPMHAIFILMYGCLMSVTNFLKKSYDFCPQGGVLFNIYKIRQNRVAVSPLKSSCLSPNQFLIIYSLLVRVRKKCLKQKLFCIKFPTKKVS